MSLHRRTSSLFLPLLCGAFLSLAAPACHAESADVDLTFDLDGKVIVTPPGRTGVTVAVKAFLEPGNKYLVAGQSGDSSVLMRFNENGSLDTSFNGTGSSVFLYPRITSTWTVLGAARDSSGNVYVLGSGQLYQGYKRSSIVKFTANGAIDSSFGTSGEREVSFPGVSRFG